MKLYYNSDGTVFAGFGLPSLDSIAYANLDSIAYDSHTNPDLRGEVYADPTAYSVTNGVLTRDGEPVTIAPPCDDCQTLDAVLGSEPATVQQLQAALKLLIAKPGFQRG